MTSPSASGGRRTLRPPQKRRSADAIVGRLAAGGRPSCRHEGMQALNVPSAPRCLVMRSSLDRARHRLVQVVNRPRSLNAEYSLGSSLRRLATAKVLPVYLQEPTCLRTAGTAGQCLFRTSCSRFSSSTEGRQIACGAPGLALSEIKDPGAGIAGSQDRGSPSCSLQPAGSSPKIDRRVLGAQVRRRPARSGGSEQCRVRAALRRARLF